MGARIGRAYPVFRSVGEPQTPLNGQPVPYATAGLYTYHIPSWVKPGHLIDIVGIGGGVGGRFFASGTADGGLGGTWNAQTFTYGTDIPSGVTDLTVLVGSGSTGQTVAQNSVVGYGVGATPAFDAVGSYAAGNSVASLTMTHTATAGAWGVLAVSWIGTLGGLTYAGSSAGLVFWSEEIAVNGASTGIALFPTVPGGAQSVVITASGTFTNVAAIPASYTGVGSLGIKQANFGTSASLSQFVHCSAGQLAVQAFGAAGQTDAYSAFAGGTERAYGINSGISPLALSDTTSDTTFTATGSNGSASWTGISGTFNPTLSTTLFTALGGSAINTANPGLGPGNETFAGKTYIGGATQSTPGSFGNSPGGGSAGGDASHLPGLGGDGAVFITARRS